MLTEAEQRVLEYVQARKLDAETAVRLGIPVGDVKDRIAAMLTKLELPDRAALVAWTGEEPERERDDAGAAEDAEGEELGEQASRPGRPGSVPGGWRTVVGSLGALAVVACAVFVLRWESRGTAEEPGLIELTNDSALQPASTLAMATATPGPELVIGLVPGPLGFAQPVALPAGYVLFVATGCIQCDQPVTSIARVYGRVSGEPSTRTLFTAPLPSKDTPNFRPYISSYAVSPDGRQLYVAVCTALCPRSDEEGAGGTNTVFRSLDGGVTWEEWLAIDGRDTIVGVGEGQVLVTGVPDGRYRYIPSNAALHAPNSGLFPAPATNGDVIWWGPGGLLAMPGARVIGPEPMPFARPMAISTNFDFLVRWEREGEHFVGVISHSAIEAIYTSKPGPLDLNARFSQSQFAGNIFDSGLSTPVLVDLGLRTISPIAAPFELAPFRNGRNTIIGGFGGAFYEVTTPGDCLNVRDEPDTSAPILTCARDGILLRSAGAQATGWAQVTAPDGTEGWSRVSDGAETYLVR